MSPAAKSDLSPHCHGVAVDVSAAFSAGGLGVSGRFSLTGALEPPAEAGLRVAARVLGTGAPAS